ncbi:MAG TPA: formate dehydrogenase accessory sulfurtransferase FdhD [Thermoanaerobaculia bacterium]|nr:formate dehydrogenase accessory sulfurtransferase FdhD [Thermoanaerobaculia bacterium]
MDPVGRERVRVYGEEGDSEREDAVAVEEPLRIAVRSASVAAPVSFATTMRTPGDDAELAAGLLFTEGVLERPDDLLSFALSEAAPSGKKDNSLVATLADRAFERARHLRREIVIGSACGICGSDSIDEAVARAPRRVSGGVRIARDVLFSMPDRLRARQSIFAQTGGLHGAALFDAAGSILEIREDIGRHNATDKVIGAAFRRGVPRFSETALLVSGRAGFEIVQKANAAGIPVVASVSAPSSLAVALADAAGMTLVGFLRDRRFNVYAHPGRIAPLSS